jgi:hypothetical protein
MGLEKMYLVGIGLAQVIAEQPLLQKGRKHLPSTFAKNWMFGFWRGYCHEELIMLL